MPEIRLKIEYYHDVSGAPAVDDEITRGFLLYSSDRVVILRLETKTKHPVPVVYCGAGFDFKTKAGNYASVRVLNLPFSSGYIIAEADRYGFHVVLFCPADNDAKQIYGN